MFPVSDARIELMHLFLFSSALTILEWFHVKISSGGYVLFSIQKTVSSKTIFNSIPVWSQGRSMFFSDFLNFSAQFQTSIAFYYAVS